jgi:UDP-glucose 4-epimerase
MKKKCVLVVGGAGFIGSYVNKCLNRAGYNTIVLDNLSKGHRNAVCYGTFIEGDIADKKLLNQIFQTHSIDAVMHFAGLTDVGESMRDPLKYYINNVAYTLNLLESMQEHAVNNFIFSSSAAIFGVPQKPFIDVDHPQIPINPYGQSKLMVETILKDLSNLRHLKYCSFRYFNAAGGDPDGEIKNYRTKENNLIPVILQNLQSKIPVTINGTDYPTFDGTCIRDYVHIHDIATAHISAMERLFNGYPSACYNLGNGSGFSIKQVIESVERMTNQKVITIEGARRDGDPHSLVACSDKAKKELGWQPLYPDLDLMVSHAWQALDFVR